MKKATTSVARHHRSRRLSSIKCSSSGCLVSSMSFTAAAASRAADRRPAGLSSNGSDGSRRALGHRRHLVGLARLGIMRVRADASCMIRSFSSRHFFSISSSSAWRTMSSMPDGEMARHAAHAADPIADRAHDLRQFLGADEDQREDRDDRDLGGIEAEHVRLGELSGLRRLGAAAAATGSAGRGVTSIGSRGASSRGSWRGGSLRRCSS